MTGQNYHKRAYSPEFKLKVVLESIQRDTTIEAVCRKYNIGRTAIHRWRNEFKQRGSNIFLDKRNPKKKAIVHGFKPGESPDELKKIIADLTVEKEILKKAQGLLS